MVNLIFTTGGHKMVRNIQNREEFLSIRNSAANLQYLEIARKGNRDARLNLVQFAYNDLMPDGKVAGCCHPSDCFFHDIDCYDEAQAEATKEKILSLKTEIGLLMMERSASGGFHLVCKRERGKTILENQVRIACIMQIEMDTNCHDLGRVVFSTSGSCDDLVYLDDQIFDTTITVEESEKEYKLLKERARKGLEEVPPMAKKENKHYRPWIDEDEDEPEKTPATIDETEMDDYPDNYHGYKFEDIIKMYWQIHNHGFEPTIGDRDAKTYQLARDLQYICGRNFHWLDKVIPCYDGFSLEEKQAKIRSALQSSYEGVPKSMQDVLDALEEQKAHGSQADDSEQKPANTEFYFNAPQPPAIPAKLPKLIKLLVSKTPAPYKAAVANAVFPSLGAHLYQTNFKYTDNVLHEATLMNCLMAESGGGKSCIDEPINHIMADIRERDKANEKREAEWKEDMTLKGANKDKPKRPENLIIQEIHGDMTNAALVTRTDEAQGHFLYVKVNEIQMFDALKGNGKAGHQYLVMCLSFDPNNRYGQTRVGTQSVTKTVTLRFNWNACTTIKKGRQYFKSVVTDGPVQRINFCTIPKREIGAEQLVYGEYDEAFDEALRPYIQNLGNASGLIECPQAFRLAKKLQKECQDIAVLSQSRTFDDLSHRACVIAWLKACVLYVANGCKWEKSIEEFVRWSLQHDLWCKMSFFGPLMENDADDFTEPRRGPKNMLSLVPDTFTIKDVERARLMCGLREDGADAQLRQWKSRKFVTVVTDNYYKKLKFLSA